MRMPDSAVFTNRFRLSHYENTGASKSEFEDVSSGFSALSWVLICSANASNKGVNLYLFERHPGTPSKTSRDCQNTRSICLFFIIKDFTFLCSPADLREDWNTVYGIVPYWYDYYHCLKFGYLQSISQIHAPGNKVMSLHTFPSLMQYSIRKTVMICVGMASWCWLAAVRSSEMSFLTENILNMSPCCIGEAEYAVGAFHEISEGADSFQIFL